MGNFTIGLDFGTLSVRAVLMNLANGKIHASCTHAYKNGVITERLPNVRVTLPDLWCLQDPNDYIEGMTIVVRQIVDDAIAQGITKNRLWALVLILHVVQFYQYWKTGRHLLIVVNGEMNLTLG